MKPRAGLQTILWRLLLRGLALMLATEHRHEWSAEWQSELWYAGRTLAGKGLSFFEIQGELSHFFWGAVCDAAWLQWRSENRRAAVASPFACLGLMLAGSLFFATLAFLLFGSKHDGFLPQDKETLSIVRIARDGLSQSSAPSIRLDQYQAWTSQAQNLFENLAFYRVVKKRVHFGSRSVELSLITATPTLEEVLSLPLEAGSLGEHSGKDEPPSLVLSDAAWDALFHRDGRIIGTEARVGMQRVVIAGVAAADTLPLSGRGESYLLENEAAMGPWAPLARGFVVARMRPSVLATMTYARWHMTVPLDAGGFDRFECAPLVDRFRQPIFSFLFSVMLALLALPATTSLRLGEYGTAYSGGNKGKRLRRWAFLAAKFVLILPLLFFLSFDFARGLQLAHPGTAESIAFLFSFPVCLAAFRWILRDQRQRCPVCLQLLKNPARVGQPSRVFLAWNGTEMICAGGHGLLHVPELPTSWFSTQRWLSLDSSWKGLFEPAGLASPGSS